MKTKNHIKANNEDLRGIGKLGWTESSRVHSTVKRLVGTFDEGDGVGTKTTKKIKVKCPNCGKNFSNVKGVIPKHPTRVGVYNPETKVHGYETVICNQKPKSFVAPKIDKNIKSTVIDEVTYNLGDVVIISPMFSVLFNVTAGVLVERKIEKIHKMSNDTIEIKFEFTDRTIPVSYLKGCIAK